MTTSNKIGEGQNDRAASQSLTKNCSAPVLPLCYQLIPHIV